MRRLFDSVIGNFFSLGTAILMAQAPEFFQQYHQRLAGHLKELQLYRNYLQHAAEISGKTLQQYLEKFLVSSDPDFVAQGKIMQEMITRLYHVEASLSAMQKSTAITKPFAFFQHLQAEIAYDCGLDFRPALSLTMEGIGYGIVGFFLGSLIYKTLKFSFGLLAVKLPIKSKIL